MIKKYKYTPENITALDKNQIFVFGSNLMGYHSGGAAKIALDNFGAIMYNSIGIQGNSYAIPTKYNFASVLSINKIGHYVDEFIEYAKKTPNKEFLVTKIGCGIAGFKIEDIAPLFKNAITVDNICLPIEFVEHIESLK